MRVAVVGLGVTGSYLVNRLARETDYEIHGFERRPEALFHRPVCGWGIAFDTFSYYAEQCDLDPNEFFLREGKTILG